MDGIVVVEVEVAHSSSGNYKDDGEEGEERNKKKLLSTLLSISRLIIAKSRGGE